MKPKLNCLLVCSALLCLAQTAPDNSNSQSSAVVPTYVGRHGILVGAPKIYDDYYLQTLLTSLKNNLSAVHVVDQATLLSHIGNTQGADLRQLSAAVQAGGPSTPQTSNFTLASGVPPIATATTPGTTTTVNAATPTAPTPPAPSLTLPSIGQSSLDTFNESLQLSAEIMNVQLLLDGALSDRLQRSDGKARSTVTIGFPVTIDNPNEAAKSHQNDLAEIQIDVCPAANLPADPPLIVTLLPRERTYNVASLVDKSFLGSISAILGGAFNVGGSILWGHKTYYLVQQQETVAYQNPPWGRCGTLSSSFSWQIRPVLGKKYVRPGTSQQFVQISVPRLTLPTTGGILGTACVAVGWRKTLDKGNRVQSGDLRDQDQQCFQLTYFDTHPAIESVKVSDIGQGNVAVRVGGTFLPGERVRVGSTVIIPTRSATSDAITFYVSAQDLLRASGAYVLSRESQEIEIVQSGAADVSGQPHPAQILAASVKVSPYSDTQTLIVLPFNPPSNVLPGGEDGLSDPWVVTIGDKVFGLRDSPFLRRTAGEIVVVAPNDLLATNRHVEVRRLLWSDEYYRAKYDLRPDQFPVGAVSVSKISTTSTRNGLVLSLQGTELKHALLVYPKPGKCCQIETIGNTYATVSILKPEPAARVKSKPAKEEEDPSKDLKQIVLCRSKGTPPASAQDCDDNYPALVLDVPKPEDTAKPALKAESPVLLTAKQMKITGDQVPKVALIEFEKAVVNFRLSADKKPALVVDLPPSVAGHPGMYPFLVTLEDKTTQVVPVTIGPGS